MPTKNGRTNNGKTRKRSTGAQSGSGLVKAALIQFQGNTDKKKNIEKAKRYVKQAAADGAFSFSGLPPGGYMVIALDKLPEGMQGPADALSDPDFLERLSRDASHVALSERQTATVTLRAFSVQ